MHKTIWKDFQHHTLIACSPLFSNKPKAPRGPWCLRKLWGYFLPCILYLIQRTSTPLSSPFACYWPSLHTFFQWKNLSVSKSSKVVLQTLLQALLGAIVIKWANNDKRLKDCNPFCGHFHFLIDGIFGWNLLQYVIKTTYNFLNTSHFLY
jgi:hypothetical protein